MDLPRGEESSEEGGEPDDPEVFPREKFSRASCLMTGHKMAAKSAY